MVDSWNAAILNEAVQNGGGATGRDELSEMRDVTLTTPASGEVLSYNGSKWVNEALNASDIVYGESDVDSTLDAMNEIKEYTIPTDPDDYGSFVFKRQGDVVCFQIRNPKSLTASAWTTIGNVPADFRPLSDIYAYFVIPATTGDTIGMLLQPNGDLRLYNYTTNTGSINTSYLGSFIIS